LSSKYIYKGVLYMEVALLERCKLFMKTSFPDRTFPRLSSYSLNWVADEPFARHRPVAITTSKT
jgi:hypothetical protein